MFTKGAGLKRSDYAQRVDWLSKELERAYLAARRGKSKKPEVIEFNKQVKENLADLASEIYNKSYRPGPSTAFIVNRPVKREIFAASFRDRVVHRLLFNQVNPWWDARFITDSYSCRKGKGVLYGVRRLDHHIRSVSHNYSRPAYVLKLDLEGYFMSMNRKLIYQRAMWGLNRQFPQKGYTYQVCQFLWKEIIFNDPIKNIVLSCPRSAWQGLPPSKSLFRQPPGQGIAIGNLTSQLLSNIYLDQLDRYVTFNLGFKHYGRYVDDFFIVHQDKDRLVKAITDINKYLKSDLKLKLHPKKQYLQECHKGVPFLGAVIYPHRIHPGSRLKRNLPVALKDGNSSVATYFSYTGLVGHYRHKRLLEGIKAPVGV